MNHTKKGFEGTHYFFGDYVLTGIPNTFNNKTSWWLSKKDCTVAQYCFSSTSWMEYNDQMEHIDNYIRLLEDRLKAPSVSVETPEGTLTAQASGYAGEGYPGIDITLRRKDGEELSIALVEHIPGGESLSGYDPEHPEKDAAEEAEAPLERRTINESGIPICTSGLVTRVWNTCKTLGTEEHIRLFHPDFDKLDYGGRNMKHEYVIRITEENVDGCGSDAVIYVAFTKPLEGAALTAFQNTLRSVKAEHKCDDYDTEDFVQVALDEFNQYPEAKAQGIHGKICDVPYTWAIKF